MKITFSQDIPIERTMMFESCYETGLSLSFGEKLDIINRSIGTISWMLVDDKLAGEIYGVKLYNMDEEIENCEEIPSNAIYCYSTTILPEFQGKDLSKILKSFWLGMCNKYTSLIVGHSTSETMKHVNEFFGAIHSVEHKNWYGTNRTAWFYRLELK